MKPRHILGRGCMSRSGARLHAAPARGRSAGSCCTSETGLKRTFSTIGFGSPVSRKEDA
jgi:hypothetical protein